MIQRLNPEDADRHHWPILSALRPTPGLVQVALNRPVCVVGARGLVNLPLHSTEISKAHTLIVQDSQGVYLRDLASRNHTYVNGHPVSEVWLIDGDLVKFGPFAFRCRRHFPQPTEIGSAPPAELWVEIDGSQRLIPIENQSFLIGARKGCDLQLKPGAEVAWAHAVMFVRDGRRYIRDLSSSTGTFLNGQAVHEAELADETEITIGPATMLYRAAPSQMTLVEDSAGVIEPAASVIADDALVEAATWNAQRGLLDNDRPLLQRSA